MPARTTLAYLALAAMPFLFSTNMILGRYAATVVEPWTLAFLRWLIASAILWALAGRDIGRHAADLRRLAPSLAILGVLGMWLCGGLVYVGLRHTTATNGALVYSTAAIFVLLLEWAIGGRSIRLRDGIGVAVCFAGVALIIAKGEPANLLQLQFNLGDLIFLTASVGWAAYTLMMKRPEIGSLPTMVSFAVIAAVGTVSLAPFAAWEMVEAGSFPTSHEAWLSILGVAIIPSILAFSAYLFGIKVLGARPAAMFTYLMIPASVGMAWAFLGERIEPFHVVCTALILGGIIIATAPIGRPRDEAA